MNAAALLLFAVAFAFPDEQGTRLLATGDVAKPELLRIALCTGGRHLAIAFERRQIEGRNSTGRQTPRNFAETAGAVFRTVSGTVQPGATCVLTEDSFVSGATLVPLQRPPDNARCSRSAYPQLEEDKKRPVVGCWPIAESTAGLHIAVLEFSRFLTQALASVAVIDGERRMYVDYPAVFTGPGDDLWRADDGGNIHANGFEIVLLLKRGETYVIGIDWAGTEGSALSLHIAEDGGPFRVVLRDSWYRSPL